MRSGLGDDGATFYNVVYTDDWIQATIEQGVTSIPGSEFAYTTSGTHLLSVILSRASGMSSLEFGKKYLFDPLGIVCEGWFQDPQGHYWGGNDMRFTPRDMARFGMLFLEQGTLDGEEILPRSWIRNSVQPASGGDWAWGGLEATGYGYLWWVGWIGDYSVQVALGHGGQTVVIIPDLDLIVVTTAYVNPDWQEAGDQESAITELIRDSILPAVVEP
jgi:CubicO group peptidase (beta-lactamase class C family)